MSTTPDRSTLGQVDDCEITHRRKRQRTATQRPDPRGEQAPKQKGVIRSSGHHDWSDLAFFALARPTAPFELDDSGADDAAEDQLPQYTTDRASWDTALANLLPPDGVHNAEPAVVTDILYPDLPSATQRSASPNPLNPFSENAGNRHQSLREPPSQPPGKAVNSYIKISIQTNQKTVGWPAPRRTSPNHKHSRGSSSRKWTDIIPQLPPHFGRTLKLDEEDLGLLNFYIEGYCGGRTLIPKHNFWLSEITAMAESDPCVKHALLALAGSYILDYCRHEPMRQLANRHYLSASNLITQGLESIGSQDVGKSDALIAAVVLLEVDDEVNWELRRPKSEIPTYYRGGLLAKTLLDFTDPGYRYWKRDNIQCSRAWAGNANFVALSCILPEIMAPISSLLPNERNYSWLLWGTEREVHTIYGATGLSPKLLHTFAQITRLCELLAKTPTSVIIPMSVKKIQDILDRFRQRSELSEGYKSAAALLESCKTDLDGNGKVKTARKVTELTGECWVCAAKVYLHCRFFRKPLSHPDIQSTFKVLKSCVQLMPQDGDLFTAQAPFFPITLMATISYTPEDRAVARDWFEWVVSESGARSSVPPVWETVKLLWIWVDEHLVDLDDTYDETVPIGLRRSWWEELTEYVLSEVGWMSLT